MFTETHTDPTGNLILAIDRAEGGTISIGFAGFPWHTHPNLLTPVLGATEMEALEGFKQAILGNRVVIAVVRKAQEITQVSITGNPEIETQWLAEDETLELRYWDGRIWAIGDQIMAFD